ncbi:hypothetical protein PD5205_02484 [Xanthomonas fragariae]|uniref:Uncharacterized protein n=1 Tax=Xanthomonas fragariae TaxID=48664 RepID=A0A1Y6HEE2_9XANT|nr:hypothetical protein PD885_02521 [Xanthomonas fragariae]SMR03775.1 hypothetical protein PD5205_02484 [Xanthomonas fragariae]
MLRSDDRSNPHIQNGRQNRSNAAAPRSACTASKHACMHQNLADRGRGALTAPDSVLAALLKAMHTDHLDGSLPAHRRGTLCGMDTA